MAAWQGPAPAVIASAKRVAIQPRAGRRAEKRRSEATPFFARLSGRWHIHLRRRPIARGCADAACPRPLAASVAASSAAPVAPSRCAMAPVVPACVGASDRALRAQAPERRGSHSSACPRLRWSSVLALRRAAEAVPCTGREAIGSFCPLVRLLSHASWCGPCPGARGAQPCRTPMGETSGSRLDPSTLDGPCGSQSRPTPFGESRLFLRAEHAGIA